MYDTHCHLTFDDLRGDLDTVMAESRAAGVRGVITISTSSEDCLAAMELADRVPDVWCSSGIHPLYSDRPIDWDRIRRAATHPRCVAWGELGLDNHYDRPPAAVQREVLEAQLARLEQWTAEGLSKPVVLHCREAFDDLIPILRQSSLPAHRCVFHCFTGTPEEARQCLDFGAMISFTGVVTFRNATGVAEAARLVPDDRIMVETDAPFLSPEPLRSKWPNRPSNVVHVARFLAALRGVEAEAFERILDRNAERFFGLPAGPGSA